MSYFRPNIEAMEGYQPGEQPTSKSENFIKLNTNENPYPPSPKVIEAIQAELSDEIRLYPDPISLKLRKKIGDLFGFDKDEVIIGNGSDDILTMICRAFAGEGELIVQPFPTYSLYGTLAKIQGARILSVPFKELTHLPKGLIKKDARITFIANPNSPTGTMVSTEELDELASRIDGVLVVDEAYIDFASQHSLDLVHKHKNVIVLRTFSKSFSLAGLRIGFGFGHFSLINGLFKVKDSYNVNRLSQSAGLAALDDISYMHQTAEKIRKTRELLAETLTEMGLYVFTSQSNFLWVQCSQPFAQTVYEELKNRRILVRFFSHPELNDCIRITIGTQQEIATLITELKTILKEKTGA